ncbi:ATP-binding cassette domain-containing protein [Herbidospora mongoliensis]|uniref:ATP-binding cassette domain-containing protein n=1 Tax=Herbidospora mongoliensis TaxID=688067 RepID=UPI000AD8F70F|nr:ATP-binding cassette domain-containing protein [Herbidospora mongoliensis]
MITADRLVKDYGKVRALDELTLDIPPGIVFGLLGPNGAGKSTTIKILTTLSAPTSGSAVVAGHDVMKNPDKVRTAIGCVTQKPGIDPAATGRENLRLQAALYGMRTSDRNTRITHLLGRFGLDAAADRPARTYSGGMQRKLDIAMGLIHRPTVLFLDEPTTGLDPEARAETWAEIGRLTDEGMTILLTTHYLEEADRLAARLAIVDRGRVVALGTPDSLKSELQGDAIHVDLADPAAATEAVPILKTHGREVTVSGRTVRARVHDGAAAVPAVLAALDAAGVTVASVAVSRPSLDDVYLRHTGRSFADASGEVAA